MEVSSVGLEEECDEIELSLGLSIGGNFRKIPKLIPGDKKATNAVAVSGVENQDFSGHSRAQSLVGDSEAESRAEYVDPQRKREVNALRRQEAKRKRGEKLRKPGLMIGGDFSDDNMCLEAQQRVQVRDRDGEMRENEANIAGNECKGDNNEEREGLSLTATHNGAQKMGQGSSAAAYGSIPLVPYPPLQFVPFTNGFAFPCVMPCLAPTSSNCGSEKNEGNVHQTLACRNFWPSHGGTSSGNLLMGGSDSEYNSGKDGINRNAVSNGSLVCSSSVVSENGSSPQQGSSSDTGRDSSPLKPEQSQMNSEREHSVPSSQTEPPQVNSKRTNTERAVPCGTIQSSLTKLIEQPDSETQPNPDNKPNTSQNPNPGPLRAVRDRDLDTHSLPQMPYVSTTGNGPNGKTITGFLYRYSKAEVSIVCVCHGSSFSPAEFVEHAGGKDITHPLKHITVIPSAFA